MVIDWGEDWTWRPVEKLRKGFKRKMYFSIFASNIFMWFYFLSIAIVWCPSQAVNSKTILDLIELKLLLEFQNSYRISNYVTGLGEETAPKMIWTSPFTSPQSSIRNIQGKWLGHGERIVNTGISRFIYYLTRSTRLSMFDCSLTRNEKSKPKNNANYAPPYFKSQSQEHDL